jgi:signal transduction histidine kinase
LRQIVREGVANGARHGRANKILINLSTEAGRLRLLIEDNGVGFLEAGEHAHPWSIQERVVLLGGEVSLSVESEATRLVISLPLPGTNDRL